MVDAETVSSLVKSPIDTVGRITDELIILIVLILYGNHVSITVSGIVDGLNIVEDSHVEFSLIGGEIINWGKSDSRELVI